MKEIEMFIQRQQMMKEAHKEQVERVSEPSTPPIVVETSDLTRENDMKLVELRQHIARLRGDLVDVAKLPTIYHRQLARYGRIYDRGEIK